MDAVKFGRIHSAYMNQVLPFSLAQPSRRSPMRKTKRKLQIMKKIVPAFLVAASFAFALGAAKAQTEQPKAFEFSGKEISVEDVPALKGRWHNRSNTATQSLRFEAGNVFIWGTTRQCGEDKLSITKAFQDGDVIMAETGPSKDQIRCNTTFGRYYRIDTKTKQGTYHIKASSETNQVSSTGRIEID